MPLKVVNPLVFLNFLMSVCGGVCWGRFDFQKIFNPLKIAHILFLRVISLLNLTLGSQE